MIYGWLKLSNILAIFYNLSIIIIIIVKFCVSYTKTIIRKTMLKCIIHSSYFSSWIISSWFFEFASKSIYLFQVLERLGFAKDTSGAQVTVGKGIRKGDSPIYYIKLPPLPYYYVQQNSIHTTPHPFQQVKI